MDPEVVAKMEDLRPNRSLTKRWKHQVASFESLKMGCCVTVSLKLTVKAPENRRNPIGNDRIPNSNHPFSGYELLVSGAMLVIPRENEGKYTLKTGDPGLNGKDRLKNHQSLGDNILVFLAHLRLAVFP